MSKSEVWKDVAGYAGVYQVSNLGRVRSVYRTVKYSDGRKYVYEGKIIKPTKNKNRGNYLYVTLSYNQKRVFKSLHRLVAETFIKNVGDKPEVNHIDGDKGNNKVSNLEWVTSKENSEHAVKNGLLPSGQYSHHAVFSNDQVRNMRKEYKGGLRLTDLAKRFRVNPSTMHSILNYRTYKNVED